ncbi:hypothetical protein [Pseudooceanicola nanhaiensis]|uniref:hypothetical protein n=1 Tax=Pseudooceanicola nanhaiensis TaxID=375761 RepID=UPI001CD7DFD5|nr:hypothetical protein [Pseudooceanicola nanhaiensis]MCA0921657.1 hypothetical protein [Pseudooceanicola nanhaiensis]
MFRPILLAAALTACLPSAATAQSFSPVGVWRCIMESVVVLMDVVYQLNPDGSLAGQGSILYKQTSSGFYQLQGYGRWLANPTTGMVTIQLVPQNHSAFSIEVMPQQDPSFMYYNAPNTFSGGMTQTTCQRAR